jgi:predicted glycosyltransferase
MKLLFYLGHPAHFHLFKNVIRHFESNQHSVHILIKKKDVLEDLLNSEGITYFNIFPKTRGGSKIAMTKTILKRNFRLMKYCLKVKPDLLIGTSVENTHIGKLLNIPTINVNEDDHGVVPLYSHLSYPLANIILAPTSCSTGKWEHKTIHYHGYHELAYLHPNHFTPRISIVEKYIPANHAYFLIRFAKLNAHHDKGIRGINKETALQIIDKLKPYGKVLITSEKHLEPEFEPYRLSIDPVHMHHIIAFASLYIGDSQTMAAEAGVLGTPFIRYNDFVGRIGYLNELENNYRLGYGISPSQPERLFSIIDMLLSAKNLGELHQKRRALMLNEKIDVGQFMIWFIENFPQSKLAMTEHPEIQYRFGHKPVVGKEPRLVWPGVEKIAPEVVPLNQV